MNQLSAFRSGRREISGFSLVVAILLLLVLTVFSLLAVNVGVFEQRTSANDFRAKAVQQVAESGLNHGAASLRVQMNSIVPAPGEDVDPDLWTQCGRLEDSFPCGSESDLDRRENSYKFVGNAEDLNGDGDIDHFESLSLTFPEVAGQDNRLMTSEVASPGGTPFPVKYAVGALLCRIDKTADPGASESSCTTDVADTGKLNAFTLVARAEMIGEGATSTLTRVIAPIRRSILNPRLPAVVASGILQGVGNGMIVGNPNSGGFGVPVAIWSRVNFEHENGSYQTCHHDAWVRNSDIKIYEGIPVCVSPNGNTCTCGGDNLSFGKGEGSGTAQEGLDVLDVDGNTVGAYDPAAKGTLLDSTNFPCDLMQFVFGDVKARENTNGVGICEDGFDGDGNGQIDAVEDYLASFKKLDSCAKVDAELNSNPTDSRFWITGGGAACDLPGQQIGSPDNPVVVVKDGSIKLKNGMVLYGVLFGRDPAVDISDATGGDSGIEPGGGNGTIYGALVAEGGTKGKINANINIIFNAKVLNPDDPSSDPDAAELPGSWSDRYSY